METKFKVGDVVKIRKSTYCPFTPDGNWKKGKRLGVIIFINPDEDDQFCPHTVFTVGGSGEDHTWVYEESELKLVQSRADVLFDAYGIEEE